MAQEKPRVVIIGSGWGAKVQAPLFKYAGFEVYGLWVRSEAKIEVFKNELGIDNVTTDLDALLKDDRVDLVYNRFGGIHG